MDYNKIYYQLIERAKTEKREKGNGVYYEKHHIIPRCLGGTDEKNNLVLLTGDEHFVAHLLLVKIYDDPKLVFAANRMTHTNDQQVRNNKCYKWLKEKAAQAHSNRVVSEETREKLRQANLGKTKWTDEDKKKMSKSRKGHKYNTPEVRKKIGDAHRGKVVSEETREKLRQASLGNTWKDDKERVKKHIEKRKGKKHSEKWCSNISKGIRGSHGKWVYIIEGIEYSSQMDVAEKYNIHKDTVSQRCRGNTFEDWIRKPK